MALFVSSVSATFPVTFSQLDPSITSVNTFLAALGVTLSAMDAPKM